MQVAIVIQGQGDVGWDDWLDLARACETHGVPTLLRSDHYAGDTSSPIGALEAWGTICALAAVTTTVRLGTLVSPVTFRPAAVLSKLVATADRVSGGRVEVGLGTGWHEAEHAKYGFPFPPLRDRMIMLERQLRVLDEHFRNAEFSPRPVQAPRPPIIVGGSGGRRSVALAARWADEYNIANVSADEAAALREALDAETSDAGRDAVRVSVMVPAVVGESAIDVTRRERQVTTMLGRDLPEPTVRGTVDVVIRHLREYEAAGVDRVVLGLALHRDLEPVEILGREVVPAVAGARLSPDQQKVLTAIVDRLIPADETPGALALGVDRTTDFPGMPRLLARLPGFAALDVDRQDAALQRLDASGDPDFARLVELVHEAFYADARSWRGLGYSARGPRRR
jgi:alkanesulfonate monooxygenase SsuD/methylene tetrahydromethanopterin reductase-like flavin-dependent oxidoreductase (luciferase family)